jgi:hypothetical protein
MRFGSQLLGSAAGPGEDSFLETGTNRLARDLFLLTAVAALFMVMFVSVPMKVVANRSWPEEAMVARKRNGNSGRLILSVHLRRDGRIMIGRKLADEPEALRRAAKDLLKARPELARARVIVNVYRQTPSLRTADVVRSLADAGLDRSRFHLRFTRE